MVVTGGRLIFKTITGVKKGDDMNHILFTLAFILLSIGGACAYIALASFVGRCIRWGRCGNVKTGSVLRPYDGDVSWLEQR